MAITEHKDIKMQNQDWSTVLVEALPYFKQWVPTSSSAAAFITDMLSDWKIKHLKPNANNNNDIKVKKRARVGTCIRIGSCVSE